MKKTRIPIITIAVLLAVIVAPIAANLWAKHHAAQYLEEKYGDAIVVEDVSFHHVRVNPFRGEYTARADYADIEFLISRGSDTYTEAYHMRRYADLLLSNAQHVHLPAPLLLGLQERQRDEGGMSGTVFPRQAKGLGHGGKAAMDDRKALLQFAAFRRTDDGHRRFFSLHDLYPFDL